MATVARIPAVEAKDVTILITGVLVAYRVGDDAGSPLFLDSTKLPAEFRDQLEKQIKAKIEGTDDAKR